MYISKKVDIACKLSVFLVLILTLFFACIPEIKAQQNFWSKQEKIPEYYDNTEEPPFLIADQNHQVHAFNAQPLNLGNPASPKAIFYRRWSSEAGWTHPNDIIFDENYGSIDLVGVVSDFSGIVHLVFQEKRTQNLYYTYSYLAVANEPTSWSPPQLIAEKSTISGPGLENIGAIAVDKSGEKLLVIYSGSEYGSGLYYVFSSDHGVNWSTAYPIYLAESEDLVVTDPKLYVGQSGVFHSVWSTFEKSGFGGPGYYAAWDVQNQSWQNQVEMDTPGIRTPSVVEYDGNVIVSYYHASTNGNWWRLSNDEGSTWTTPIQVSPRHVGTNGNLSFAIDSENNLHAFFGERIDDNNHGLWHMVWTGASWTSPDAVVRGRQIKDAPGGNGFDPRSARAIISNGNVVLVTWGTDGAAGENGAWYSYKLLDTLELPDQPLPFPTVQIADISIKETPVSINVTEENLHLLPDELKNESTDVVQSPQTSILIGIVPVAILLVGFIVLRLYSNYRNDR